MAHPAWQGRPPIRRIENTAWHRRPWVIGVLLFFFPPLGIPLMWLRFGWSTNAKAIASLASCLWFALVLWRGHINAVAKRAENSSVTNASTSSPASSPVAEQPAPPPATGAELAEAAPLLLVPEKLDGFVLQFVAENRMCCGYHAQYVSAAARTRRLDVELWMVTSRDQPPALEISRSSKPITIAGYYGQIDEATQQRYVTVEWLTGRWKATVEVNYTGAGDRAAAKQLAGQLATEASGVLVRYVTGTPPSASEREAHLAAVAAINQAYARAARTDRVLQFIAKLREAGIGERLVVAAQQDRLGENDIVITVGGAWHRMSKQERLISAQGLWRAWVQLVRPSDADAVYIKLVDVAGNKVGGSGVMGSSIKVQD